MRSLQGQEFYFKKYKVEDGLSHNTVLCSLQDERGFLWFGTKDGLNRFDGYNFKVYKYNTDNPKSLGSNFVESLHEYKGIIWVGTDNGLFSYDKEQENFEFIEASENLPILDIDHDNEGNLWYIAGNSLVKYNITQRKTTTYNKETYMFAEDFTSMPNGTIWSASGSNLYLYNTKTNSFKTISLTINNENGLPLRISKLFALNKQTLLIGTQNHGVVSFNINTETSQKILPKGKNPLYVRDFSLKNKDELWIATEAGLFIYNLATKTYQHLKKSYNNEYAISDNALYTLMADDEKGMWIGSYFGGINYYPKQYSHFDKYFPKPGENSISGNAVREIKKDNAGNLWIGTEDAGLNKFNIEDKSFTSYTHTGKNKTLSHYNIHALLAKKNTLWVGTFEHGLDLINMSTGKRIKHYAHGDRSGLSSNFVFAMYEDEKGIIYTITASGIQQYNSATDNFTTLDSFKEGTFYTTFHIDSQGVFWGGSYWGGLYSYNPKNKKKEVYKHHNNNPKSISSNGINGIYEDHNETLWITTENGLNKYDKKTNSFKTYSINDGFPSNVFYAIIEGDNNMLWISTSNGLVAFNPETETKQIYTKANGLLSDQFNYNSAFKDDNGILYFGSVGGLISFKPESFEENTFQPPIFITSLKINNEEVTVGGKSPLNRSITDTNEIVLKPNESTFSLDFSSLGYSAPKTTEYWYQLQGLDDAWINLEKKHQIAFTQLPAGNYVFKVKSLNNHSVWSKVSVPLKIKVLPVFWKSRLAYLLYTLLLALLIFLGFRLYHQRVNAKNSQRIRQLNNRKEKEIYEAKIEFFTNISHEIRTPLTLIKSPLEKVIQKLHNVADVSENLSIINKNTNRLLDLVNQLLDFRKTETDRIRLTFVETNVIKIIKNTYERFSEAVQDRSIDFKIEFKKDKIHAFVDAEALRKIASNLFGNAIKYAKNQVLVTIDSDSQSFTLTIQNDGKLIPVHLKDKIFEPFYRGTDDKNQTGTGIGLALAKSLTEMHQGNLTLDTSHGTLNSFVLQLPIHQEKEFTFPSKNSQPFKKEVSLEKHDTIAKSKAHILLVEDSQELLDFLAKELKEDYYVLKANNGEEAITYLEEENIQLIISDVMMPGIDGFTLCKKVKTNLETSHIPVILLTSKSAMTAKIEGLESGGDAYIEKPFSMNHLKVHITNLLENRKHVMEHYASSPLAHIRSIANTKTDETFINKLDEVIYEHMANHNLNVESLAEIMHMSRSTLYRKIKDISNLSPNELINITRLKKSAELLKTGKYRVFEVAEIVGYNSATSFGRNFQKQFKMTPTEYMQKES